MMKFPGASSMASFQWTGASNEHIFIYLLAQFTLALHLPPFSCWSVFISCRSAFAGTPYSYSHTHTYAFGSITFIYNNIIFEWNLLHSVQCISMLDTVRAQVHIEWLVVVHFRHNIVLLHKRTQHTDVLHTDKYMPGVVGTGSVQRHIYYNW